MTANPHNEPLRVRLTADHLDLKADIAFRAGTVLLRTESGQYVTEGTRLGERCVAGYFRIRDICEPI